MTTPKRFIPYRALHQLPADMLARSRSFYELMDKRRSLRMFSDRPVPEALIAELVRTASTAPSGAHKQPWMFCAVSNPELKRQIREAAEKEEFENYHGRMPDQWLQDLEPFGTGWEKPYLETAPWLIAVFRQLFDADSAGKKANYYVNESVGIACGFLLAAIHHAGLVALTHTPSPMNFLSRILERPDNERPFLLIPVGYPADDAEVPDLKRKALEEVLTFYK